MVSQVVSGNFTWHIRNGISVRNLVWHSSFRLLVIGWVVSLVVWLITWNMVRLISGNRIWLITCIRDLRLCILDIWSIWMSWNNNDLVPVWTLRVDNPRLHYRRNTYLHISGLSLCISPISVCQYHCNCDYHNDNDYNPDYNQDPNRIKAAWTTIRVRATITATVIAICTIWTRTICSSQLFFLQSKVLPIFRACYQLIYNLYSIFSDSHFYWYLSFLSCIVD